MADIGIPSNSVLRPFIPGGDTVNSVLEDGSHTTNEYNNHSEGARNRHNTSGQLNLVGYHPENEAKSSPELSQPEASSSKELIEEDLHGNNHSVWLHTAIKSEIEEAEDKDTESGEDEDSECEEEKEDKMEEESDSEEADDSEGGAYHLAEVSYGEEDEQESQKREKRESESILGISCDVYKTTNPESSHRKSSCNSSKKLSAKSAHSQSEGLVSSISGNVSGPKNFVCSICGHMAFSHDSLLEHIHNHTKENIQFCAHCNKIFRHRSNLIQHITTKHTDMARFKCNVCGLTFVKNSVFLRHQRTHTGERPFACSLCSYRSKNAGCLKDHMRKHTGEKPYMCKQCDYKCSYSSMLSRHIAAQHEKKTLVCDHCDYKTNLIRNLTKHSKQHETAHVLVCEKCDFTTHNKDKLKKHIISKHLGGLPKNYYVCSFCQMKYREKKSLKRHVMNIHKTDPQGIKFERVVVLTGQSTRLKKPSP